MQSILRWSIENSTPLDSAPSDRPPVERKDLDPAIIDLILGKPDSEQMKEDMNVATDVNKSEDERIAALDHLEMLIEQIDNANDLEKLKLWEPLHALLYTETSSEDIKTQALWVIGTALQNNPSAQDAYLSYNPLPVVLSFLDPSPSTISIRAKAIYAISGLLKHNAPAVEALGKPEIEGWSKLRNALQDPAIAVRRKAVFLLSSLLAPTSPTSSPNAPVPTNLLLSEEHPGSALSSSSTPNLQTLDDPQATSSDPIFANSHAAHLHNPSRSNTSRPTLDAFKQYNILDDVVSAVTSPLPYGEDGENTDVDPDFEEKAMHLLYTYAVTCQIQLAKSHKEQLKSWIQSEKKKDGEKRLLEKWNLSREDYATFVGKLI